MSINQLYRLLTVAMSALLLVTLAPQAGYSAEKAVNVYYNGQLIRFDEAKPVVKDGRALVPFRKLFETLGFTVKWVDSGSLRQAIGTKDGLKIELTIDRKTAKVDGKSVALDVPAQIVSGSTMVPLRFVSENSGYRVSFKSGGSVSEIRILSGGEAVEDPGLPAGGGEAEPYVVKGRVVDAQGLPVQGAEVFADNQLLYNSNLVAVTDADGYYRIELTLLATTWNMGGSYTAQLDGSPYKVELTPDIDRPFAGNTGAVRNFTLRTETVYGELYLYMDLNDFMNGYMEKDVKLTLTPVSSAPGGRVISGYGYNFPGGFGMNDVPVGRYEVTALYAPPGEEPVPMEIRVRNGGEYAESAEFEFSPLVPGIYQAELEVSMP